MPTNRKGEFEPDPIRFLESWFPRYNVDFGDEEDRLPTYYISRKLNLRERQGAEIVAHHKHQVYAVMAAIDHTAIALTPHDAVRKARQQLCKALQEGRRCLHHQND